MLNIVRPEGRGGELDVIANWLLVQQAVIIGSVFGLLVFLLRTDGAIERFIKLITTLIDALDSPGGHMLIAFVLVMVSIGMMKGGLETHGKELLLLAAAVLFKSSSGTEKANGKPYPKKEPPVIPPPDKVE